MSEEKKFDFGDLGDKFKELVGIAGNLADQGKDKLKAAIDDLQSDIVATQTSLTDKANEYKGQAFSQLLEAKMNLSQQAEEIKKQIEIKADDIVEGTKSAKAKAAYKYAELMSAFAEMAAKEAAKAKLEAEVAKKEAEEADE